MQARAKRYSAPLLVCDPLTANGYTITPARCCLRECDLYGGREEEARRAHAVDAVARAEAEEGADELAPVEWT